MQKPDNNGSRMMLTELIFSIFFFMVIVAVCIQLFAGAFIAQKNSKELSLAVNVCASEADRFIATGKEPVEKYYNLSGDYVDAASATYILTSEKVPADNLDKIVVIFKKLEDETEIYSLEVERGL